MYVKHQSRNCKKLFLFLFIFMHSCTSFPMNTPVFFTPSKETITNFITTYPLATTGIISGILFSYYALKKLLPTTHPHLSPAQSPKFPANNTLESYKDDPSFIEAKNLYDQRKRYVESSTQKMFKYLSDRLAEHACKEHAFGDCFHYKPGKSYCQQTKDIQSAIENIPIVIEDEYIQSKMGNFPKALPPFKNDELSIPQDPSAFNVSISWAFYQPSPSRFDYFIHYPNLKRYNHRLPKITLTHNASHKKNEEFYDYYADKWIVISKDFK